MREDSGERGFPSPQTTKSESNSTVPTLCNESAKDIITLWINISFNTCAHKPLLRRTGIKFNLVCLSRDTHI